MKTLILSITAGYGHHSAAKSISDELEALGVDVKTVDVYNQINEHLCKAVNKGYLLSTKHVPRAYRTVYELLDAKEAPAKKYAVQNIIGQLIASRFEKFIEDFQPDVMVCTHIFAAQVINELKRRGKFLDVPTIGIVTDYTFHPFWEDVTNIEYIVTASELLKQRAIVKGIQTERLLPFGIPIQGKFTTKTPKEVARKTLGLPLDKRIILVMAGSMGYGNMPDIVSGIHRYDKSCHIIAVCGNNKKLYKKLVERKYSENVHIFGFSDNVDIMMDAADCLVTKPGGLTTTEALAKNLPMILVTPIPGQEERNLEFFLNSGVALSVTKNFLLDEALYFLFEDENHFTLIHNRLSTLAKPNAARDIAKFIINLKK